MREFNSWEEAKAHYTATTRAAALDELVILSGISEDVLYDDIIKAEQGQDDVDAALKTAMQGTVKVMTLSDIEVPYANLKMINHAVKVALEQGVKIVVLNGDITHSDFFSKHAKDTYVSPAEEYQQLEQLVAFFASKFEQVILVRGNHDDMVERFCQRHFGLEHMKFLVRYDLLANVADNYANVTYARNWWTKIGDAVYGHPYNYSSIPMRTALIAANSVARFTDFRAFFMGHTHQVGSIIVDGVYYTETGCSCNMQGYAFKRVQKTRWVNAFNISEFVDGKIQFNGIRNFIHGTAPI